MSKKRWPAGEPLGPSYQSERQALRVYVETHFDEITAARAAGYRWTQLAALISAELNGKSVSRKVLATTYCNVLRFRSPEGRAFAYTLGDSARVFKRFLPGGSGKDIDAAAEEIQEQTGKSVFIIAEKPMREYEFKKWQSEGV